VSTGQTGAGELLVIIFAEKTGAYRLISARRATSKEWNQMRAEYDFSKAKRGAVVPNNWRRGSPVALNVRRHLEKGTKAKEPFR
jgi:hypothetical protein